ncbi:hypothetical protein [Sporosarcina sp. P1]|uniref:hypothetical protein n=1 Tax=Sporosarcina sp. P1 TaxID=2048257 RepID=UPI000C16DF38|nr:hypothetical protein [Sporosarcina sp. P1]PIC83858.1 hypothetical protein CSV73_05880 [Sporosarcina sp. P1]
MTLVEVLATLLLVTLVTGLIWTTISISSRSSVLETNKLRLQQEGNYISTEILRIHRTCKEYEFVITPNNVSVENCQIEKSQDRKRFSISEGFIYSMGDQMISPEGVRYDIEADFEDLEIEKFKIISPENTKLSITFPLIASRYKRSS